MARSPQGLPKEGTNSLKTEPLSYKSQTSTNKHHQTSSPNITTKRHHQTHSKHSKRVFPSLPILQYQHQYQHQHQHFRIIAHNPNRLRILVFAAWVDFFRSHNPYLQMRNSDAMNYSDQLCAGMISRRISRDLLPERAV